MKNLTIFTGILAIGTLFTACRGAHGNDPGNVYMPDMNLSRAYETYGYNSVQSYEVLKEKGVNYTATPVPGSIARDDVSSAYPYPNTDTGYIQSRVFQNPFDSATLDKVTMTEAERLYLVNCAICHGTALDGNGPLWKDGNGPYPAAPRNLKDDYSKNLADGQIFHVITHGKGQMGSYASQLKPQQRWWVVSYIRSKQNPAKASAVPTDSTAVAAQ